MPKSKLSLLGRSGGRKSTWRAAASASVAVTSVRYQQLKLEPQVTMSRTILFQVLQIENNKLSFLHDMCPWLFKSFPVPAGPCEYAGPSSTFVEIDVYHNKTIEIVQKGQILEFTHTCVILTTTRKKHIGKRVHVPIF